MCYMDSLISFVLLNFFSVFRLQCFHWPTIQPSFSTVCILTDVFFTCNWIVCFIHSVIGAWRLWGQRPQQFFQRKASLPTPPPIGCMYWINVLYVLDYYLHPCVHLYTYWVVCVQESTNDLPYLIFVSNHICHSKINI